MTEYRWNQSELAAGYDAGAAVVHPFYTDVQDAILAEVDAAAATDGLIVDLGGGSGRLVERMLARWPRTTAVIIDQSQPFLDLAARRLEQFPRRITLHCLRLQDDWRKVIAAPAAAIVSMSAVHHLDPEEKRACYRRCFEALRPAGVLLNGDEVRAEADDEYHGQVERWAAHMQELIGTEAVTPAMADALRGWMRRNLDQFGEPRASGDDCHETANTQLDYLRAAGFTTCDAPWQRDLWTLLRGIKPAVDD